MVSQNWKWFFFPSFSSNTHFSTRKSRSLQVLRSRLRSRLQSLGPDHRLSSQEKTKSSCGSCCSTKRNERLVRCTSEDCGPAFLKPRRSSMWLPILCLVLPSEAVFLWSNSSRLFLQLFEARLSLPCHKMHWGHIAASASLTVSNSSE